MKKRGGQESKSGKAKQNEANASNDKKNDKKQEKLNDIILHDDIHNQGFSEWLRSSDGLEMMRLFVIANSILIFFTMGLPKMQDAVALLREYFYGEQ